MASGNDGSREHPDSIHHGAGLNRPLSDTDLDLRDQATRSTVVMNAPVPAVAGDADDDLADCCPHCGTDLSDPLSGWCLLCGYCRYLENAKEIDPYEAPPDPELQEYVVLLRVLGKQLKLALAAQATHGGPPDPALADYMQLISSLTRRCRKPGQTSADLREYVDLLRQLGQRITEAKAQGS